MKTLDGFDLKEGEECYIAMQCAEGVHHLSGTFRKAIYMDEICQKNGGDFHLLKAMKCDCEDGEVIGVWKNKPESKNRKVAN